MVIDIILLAVFATGTCILVSKHTDSIIGKQNVSSLSLYGGVLCGLFFIGMAAFLIINHFTTIGSADTVAYISTNGISTHNIYYDGNSDVYFTIRQNLWNIFKPNQREIIDSFTATKYINLINEIG